MNQSQQYESLEAALNVCIGQLRKGNDVAGLHAFQKCMDAVRDICFEPQAAAALEGPLSQMLGAIVNRDMIGLTDVLELVVYPLVKGWIEEEHQT
jgi:hypothetical protein